MTLRGQGGHGAPLLPRTEHQANRTSTQGGTQATRGRQTPDAGASFSMGPFIVPATFLEQVSRICSVFIETGLQAC